MTTAVGEPLVNFELQTPAISSDDACLQWLSSRYRTRAVGTTQLSAGAGASGTPKDVESAGNDAEELRVRLENDIAACKAHHWEKFSYSSPVYAAASPSYPLRKVSTVETVIEEVLDDSNGNNEPVGGGLRAALQDSWTDGGHGTDMEKVRAEPSRHIFTEVVKKRREEDLARKVEEAAAARGERGRSGHLRPYFGGYFHLPSSCGLTRFLIFPQWHHDVSIVSERQQWFPYFLRGTVRGKGPHVFETAAEGGACSSWRDIVLAAYFAQKFRRDPTECVRSGAWPWKEIDAIHVEGYTNQPRVKCRVPREVNVESLGMNGVPKEEMGVVNAGEQEASGERMVRSKEGVVMVAKLFESGFRMSLQFRDPRYMFTVKGVSSVVEGMENKRIMSLQVLDEYDSSVQHFSSSFLRWLLPRATYCLRYGGGPGVEFVSGGRSVTLFGKLSSEWWAELPLCADRFFLRLRSKSSLVRPFTLSLSGGKGPCDAVNNGIGVGKANTREHSMFWATNGPRWDASIVRGFQDMYPGMHHASNWFTALSMEFGFGGKLRDESKLLINRAHEGGWRQQGGMIYVNACFMDTFRNPPRASVGFSITNKPRARESTFNTLTPSSFDCSFNWWLKFGRDGVRLLSGLVEGQRVDEAVLRPSPVETFHHLRCGLTWDL